MKYITILSIALGVIQQTLYHKGTEYVCISRDGSFLASWTGLEARLWSITQGTLLAMFETECHLVFSCMNCLYGHDSGSVWFHDASTDPNNVTIKSFPLPSVVGYFFPIPDESPLLLHLADDIKSRPPHHSILTHPH